MASENKTLHPKRRAFLAAYAECCTISGAAKAAKIDRCTHYAWIDEDPDYKAQFARARSIAADTLEDEAVRRAREGTEKPVTIAGEREVIREYSDTLLIFLLKGANPERFRERASFEHTGKDGKPLMDIATARALLHSLPEE